MTNCRIVLKKKGACDIIEMYAIYGGKNMFQKKQIIYSESLGTCVVDNIVSLSANKRGPSIQYYVLKTMFDDKVSYIPVEHHQVVLRDMFTVGEAKQLKDSEQYKKDRHLKDAVDYVLKETVGKEEQT